MSTVDEKLIFLEKKMQPTTVSIEIGGRTLSIETGVWPDKHKALLLLARVSPRRARSSVRALSAKKRPASAGFGAPGHAGG